MLCGGRAVFVSVFMVWMQGYMAAPLAEGSGAFAALKSEKGTLGQTWAYLADQEGSGDFEASQFSSSSGKVPIYDQTSSIEPSLQEALSSSSSIGEDSDTGNSDSDIVFVDSDVDTEDSIPEDTTMVDSDIYELDREENEIGVGGDEETGVDAEGDEGGGNEVFNITPSESEITTSSIEDSNVIPNNVRHSPQDTNNNDLNIVSSEHGNEIGGHKGQVDGTENEATGDGESDSLSGIAGSGIMAVVMFLGAIAAGVLISFLLVTLTKHGQKLFRKKPDP